MIVAQGINDAWLKVMSLLASQGKESAPRGKRIKELKSLTVKIENPKKRILTLPIRKISLPFAFGELVWYLSGRNDLAMMEYYSKMMASFSDDGKTLNSAYGYRIFGKHPLLPFDQWANVVSILRLDPDSRQAVIHLHTPNNMKTKDEVCTLSLQFMIREGKLDMYTTMRSNDIVWGFTYDVFSFTTFQELMANELDVEVGEYYHTANSMHVYEKDFELLNDVLKLYPSLMYMTQYDTEFDYSGITRDHADWAILEEYESSLRTDDGEDFLTFMPSSKALNKMLEIFWIYRDYKRLGKEGILERLSYDDLFHCMMRQYVEREPLEDSHMLIVEGPDGAGKSTFIQSLVDDEFNRTQVIAFGKPGKDFDPFIYFHTALQTGSYVLDRFFYSELVYGRTFRDGNTIIDNDDQKVLEKLLLHRGAKLMFFDTHPETCYNRLDEADKAAFTLEDIKDLHSAYTVILRACNMPVLPYKQD
jgi:thymidylate synthase